MRDITLSALDAALNTAAMHVCPASRNVNALAASTLSVTFVTQKWHQRSGTCLMRHISRLCFQQVEFEDTNGAEKRVNPLRVKPTRRNNLACGSINTTGASLIRHAVAGILSVKMDRRFGVQPMMLRRALLYGLVSSMLALAYIASPFVSMWNLREAIKHNDIAAIETRIVWPSVRSSVRASLADHANLFPLATAAGEKIQPSLWQRVKGAFGATMLDRFVETYVTPEGLPKLFDYRTTWREAISNDTQAPEAAAGIERVKQFWARIKRAEFKSLTRIEIETSDRNVASRHYVSVLELDGLGWKLTSLRITSADHLKPVAKLEDK